MPEGSLTWQVVCQRIPFTDTSDMPMVRKESVGA